MPGGSQRQRAMRETCLRELTRLKRSNQWQCAANNTREAGREEKGHGEGQERTIFPAVVKVRKVPGINQCPDKIKLGLICRKL